MASVNKATIIGNLGRDPEVRYTANGDAVCNITVATSERWKDKTTGEQREQTEWHRIVFYRRLAEIVAQYLKKGAPVYVEGSIHTRKWTDKEGIDRYTTEIRGNEMKMLGSRSAPSGDYDNSFSDAAPQTATASDGGVKQNNAQGAGAAPMPDDLDDDIPF